ncbi:MAG: type II secretion system protein [Verrucomicrobiota bacterium]
MAVPKLITNPLAKQSAAIDCNNAGSMEAAFARRPRKSPPRSSARAFTLVEVIIATIILGLLISGALATLSHLNRFAAAMRMQTLALGVVQERIDEVLTVPWKMKSRPAILNETAVKDPPAVLPVNGGDAVVLNDDPLNTGAYSAMDTPVNARRYIYVKNITSRSVKVTVIITYTFARRSYTLSQSTLRFSDDF